MFNGKAAVLLKMPAGFRAFGAVCTHLGCIAYWKPDENDISPLPAIDIIVKEGAIYALKWKDPDYVRSISFYAGAA